MDREILWKHVIRLTGAARQKLIDAACKSDPALRLWIEARLAELTSPDNVDAVTQRLEPNVSNPESDSRIEVNAVTQDFDQTAISASAHPIESPTQERSQSFLEFQNERPTVDSDSSVSEATSDPVGTLIGPYLILEPIGQGGMGSVYLAEQIEPVARKVALKVIRAGMNSAQVIARFELERQALALMEHPNIARVFDAGTTREGLPYFVMELVQGEPITKFCDHHKLGIDARLEVFRQVCMAVQHAHQKGIIHRDLKPSNVLVTMADDRPVAKVIDFGLAKATQARVTDESMFTAWGQVVGTLEYMSPEQARLDDQDVDTRTDVYALGVMLYELLTGSTPLRRESLKNVAIAAILSRIREEEPQKPSSRISETPDRLSSISSVRRVEPRRLSSLMKGDLDWIVLKALEKERERRYESASAFAADVQRFLSDEPIEARPPSAQYRLRKFVRKHRVMVTSGSVIAILLVVGLVVSLVLLRWALDERADAITARENEKARAQEAKTAQLKAEASEVKTAEALIEAQRSDRQSRRVLKLVVEAFRSVDPAEGAGYDVPASLVLERAFRGLDEVLADDPVAAATLSLALGNSFLGLGDHQRSLAACQKALDDRTRVFGPEAPETLEALLPVFWARFRGKPDQELVTFAQQTRDRILAVHGPEHRETLAANIALGTAYGSIGKHDVAYDTIEQAFEIQKRVLGERDPDTLAAMNNLAGEAIKLRNVSRAVELYQQALALRIEEMGAEHPETLVAMNNLGIALSTMGDLAAAIEMHENTLEIRKRVLGDDHPETLTSQHHLAATLDKIGETAKSTELFLEVIRRGSERLGEDHPVVLMASSGLANSYLMSGKSELAIDEYEKILAAHRRALGDDHPSTLTTLQNLAAAYQRQGKFDRTIELNQEVLATRKRLDLPDDLETFSIMNNLGAVYLMKGELEPAIEMFEQAYAGRMLLLGSGAIETQMTANNLAGTLMRGGRQVRAAELFKELSEAASEPNSPEVLQHRRNLALALIESAKVDLELDRVTPETIQRVDEGIAVLESRRHSWPMAQAAGLATEGRRFKLGATLQLADLEHLPGVLQEQEERVGTEIHLSVIFRAVQQRFPDDRVSVEKRSEMLNQLRSELDRILTQTIQEDSSETLRLAAASVGELLASLPYDWNDERLTAELLDQALLDVDRLFKIRPEPLPESETPSAPRSIDQVIGDLETLDWKSRLTASERKYLSSLVNQWAWFRATASDASLHQGAQAVRLARAGVAQATDEERASLLDTLAAALARQGEFDEAVMRQQEAIEANQDEELAPELQERLELYQNRMAYP